MKSSANYYSSISKDYRAISDKRKAYLNSIDNLIIENAPEKVINYLDVGSGDGKRGLYIAQSIDAKNTVLLDNCEDMFTNELENVRFVSGDILNYKSDVKFDLITCLWNVLGHVGNKEDRLNALKNMSILLSKNGKLILDVNNRYNSKNYTSKGVFGNRLKDLLRIKNSGYYQLGEGENSTSVYIHKPFEIDRQAEKSGLKLIKKLYVNYSTGELEPDYHGGQLFYVFEKS